MNILEIVQPFDVVTIFRHQIADQDALGAQFGMKLFLETAFPDKKIYALGDSVGSCAKLFPDVDHVDDDTIKNSVAIVLDTADAARVDDERFTTAKKIVKIDHHIVVEDYAQVAYVDVKAAATCELLAFMFQGCNVAINKQCAKYLYYGLIADSINFTTNNTTANTLLAAAYLVSCGVNVNEVKQETSGMSLAEYNYVSDIRNKVILKGKVAYAIMEAKDYEKYGMNYNQAKEKVFAMANVNEFEIYCLFTEDTSYEKPLYNGSLRSKQVAINEVAAKYDGGGHKNACGVKKLSLTDIDAIVDDFNALFD
ncbi:MAG: bifunctional oligoribonuclease/PAP phosphatase NrnA [Erysipelotrichia bacterium]|nr:bifunctional oligoribonuclease/PAP phosphatase NrnA [Erysipelotrichia bacterium]NCC54842.1 bifunctional oligoribonuclease/PAP phosphatase NrnA [Erysipelotrichia bacterium]